jgi:hypothetical protein
MSTKPALKLITGGKSESPTGNWLAELPLGSQFIAQQGTDLLCNMFIKSGEDGKAVFLTVFDYSFGRTAIFGWVSSSVFSAKHSLVTVIREGANKDGTVDWTDPLPGVEGIANP